MLSLVDAEDESALLYAALWAAGYDASRASAVDPVSRVALPLSWSIAAARCATTSPTLAVHEAVATGAGAAQRVRATLPEVSDLLFEDGRAMVDWWMDWTSSDAWTTEHGTFRHVGDGRLRSGDGVVWSSDLWLHVHSRREARTLVLHSLDDGATAEGAGLCVHFDSPPAAKKKVAAATREASAPVSLAPVSPALKAKWESADSPTTCVRRTASRVEEAGRPRG